MFPSCFVIPHSIFFIPYIICLHHSQDQILMLTLVFNALIGQLCWCNDILGYLLIATTITCMYKVLFLWKHVFSIKIIATSPVCDADVDSWFSWRIIQISNFSRPAYHVLTMARNCIRLHSHFLEYHHIVHVFTKIDMWYPVFFPLSVCRLLVITAIFFSISSTKFPICFLRQTFGCYGRQVETKVYMNNSFLIKILTKSDIDRESPEFLCFRIASN